MGPYINPRQLEIVLVMAEELNTHKAAERLKMHQSTVSKGIKKFEKEQELTVFVREGKRIADLTPEGEQFLEHIKPAFHAFQIEAARASDIAEMILRKSAGTFIFGYSPLAPAAMLNEVRSVRSVRFPALRLQVRQLKPVRNIRLGSIWRASGRAHLCISATACLEQIPVGEEPMCAVYPRKPGTRAGVGIGLEALRTQPTLCAVFGSRAAGASRLPGIRNVRGEDSLRRLLKKRIPPDRHSTSCSIEEASRSCPSACMLEHRQI